MVEIDWKTESGLVVQHAHIDRYRATQIIQGKARPEGNGRVLFEGCNVALDYLGDSLRAGADAAACVVVPLGKGKPLPARHASHSTASSPAVPINMSVLDR